VPQGENLDMLIRSASSFLWIVKHNVKGPMNRYTAEWKRAVERLDRIATLLVTKPKLDVCAVIAEVRSDSVQLYNLAGADGTHEAALEHLLATKNSGKGKKQSQDQIPLPRKLPESRLKGDWLKAYIRQCVYTTLNSDYAALTKPSGPLSDAEHVSTLQGLCRDFVSADDGKRDALMEVKRFVYLQCKQKILQRIRVTVHAESTIRFYSLFEENKKMENQLIISFRESAWRNIRPSFQYRSEKALQSAVKKETGMEFELDANSHFVLDKESTVRFHRLIGKLFDSLQYLLESLPGRTEKKRSKAERSAVYADVQEKLCRIARLMDILADLVFRSITFQRHMCHLAIISWIKGNARQSAVMPLIRVLSLPEEEWS